MSVAESAEVLRTSLNIGMDLRELTAQLITCCERVEDERPAACVLHLTSGSGAEQNDLDVHSVNKWENALRRWEQANTLTVAIATGECGGVTLEVLMAADLRIATNDLKLTPPRVGDCFWPGTVVHRIANEVGTGRARRLLLQDACSLALSAEQARDMGIVHEVHADAASGVSSTLHAASDHAVLRRLILQAPSTEFGEALGTHLAACDRLLQGTPWA